MNKQEKAIYEKYQMSTYYSLEHCYNKPSMAKLIAYNDIVDKIKGMYDKLVDKGFKSTEAIEIVETMISSGIINERRPSVSYPGRYSSYYRR